MNKQGHVASAVAAGSVSLFLFYPEFSMQNDYLPVISMLVASAIGGLAPDIDHKTSTASKHIQLPLKYRRLSRALATLLSFISLMVLFSGSIYPDNNWYQSWSLWLGAAVLCWLLARLRSLVLIGAGSLLLVGYALYELHWIAALVGFSLLISPTVKHRGIIHTPEFAAVLSLGLISFASQQSVFITAFLSGFVIGWWAHLAGDIFGSDGIHSLFLPKIKLALRLFHNGGAIERWIARACWTVSIGLLLGMLLFKDFASLTF